MEQFTHPLEEMKKTTFGDAFKMQSSIKELRAKLENTEYELKLMKAKYPMSQIQPTKRETLKDIMEELNLNYIS